ncbi:conserved hypothetical protein [Culex quinquefasciatus]|uniref:Uncharacterized protein n=1 Tax=Culex quinquefasciatus TaxID=7176 RepID=B0X9A3_CULQU|nr:conserved hypothetical protein [Culex quinquefasciatus]|eukprot:XP_001866225.1 conserved hypothetical protein [Culex quinquefasciatus]
MFMLEHNFRCPGFSGSSMKVLQEAVSEEKKRFPSSGSSLPQKMMTAMMGPLLQDGPGKDKDMKNHPVKHEQTPNKYPAFHQATKGHSLEKKKDP